MHAGRGDFQLSHQRLILLTDTAFAADLKAHLSLGSRVAVDVVSSLAELVAAVDRAPARLVVAGSGVILPTDLLGRLPGPAYNFHPGPPEYRGLFPSVFALYDGASRFGVTCHELTAEIDSGPIVGVTRFAIHNADDRAALDSRTYTELVKLVEALAPQLADAGVPLPRLHEQWSGPVRRKADFDALCRLPTNVDEAEFRRRYRAIGEGPNHALTYEMHGQLFRLTSRSDAPVTKGGRPA